MSGAHWPLRGLGYLARAMSWRFHRALQDPAAAQARLRDELARLHATTELGRADGCTGPETVDRVPARSWSELAPDIEGALPHAITHWEPTSGSESATKLVPYTRALLGTFSRMFLVWVADLLLAGPALQRGRFYMSVSPAFDTGEGPAALEDDTDYLDGWLRPLVDRFVVRPREAERAPDAAEFRRRLARALVQEPDLEVISVWNPSFLTVLLDHIEDHRETLAPSVDEARRSALQASPVDWRVLWPALRLVSAWADGQATHGAAQLEHRLGVTLQPKGLLATECPVTVPMVGAPAGVPLVHDVLIELLDAEGRLWGLTEATEGETYELVVWARGGLPRYRLGDRVRVCARFGQTPCLYFEGRSGGVSDLVGEKLHPDHVQAVLDDLVSDARFRMLAPSRRPRDHYVLLLDGEVSEDLASDLDARLRESWHYNLAREQEQLGPPRVLRRAGLAAWWQEVGSRGRLGDTKDRALASRPLDGVLSQLEQQSPPGCS